MNTDYNVIEPNTPEPKKDNETTEKRGSLDLPGHTVVHNDKEQDNLSETLSLRSSSSSRSASPLLGRRVSMSVTSDASSEFFQESMLEEYPDKPEKMSVFNNIRPLIGQDDPIRTSRTYYETPKLPKSISRESSIISETFTRSTSKLSRFRTSFRNLFGLVHTGPVSPQKTTNASSSTLKSSERNSSSLASARESFSTRRLTIVSTASRESIASPRSSNKELESARTDLNKELGLKKGDTNTLSKLATELGLSEKADHRQIYARVGAIQTAVESSNFQYLATIPKARGVIDFFADSVLPQDMVEDEFLDNLPNLDEVLDENELKAHLSQSSKLHPSIDFLVQINECERLCVERIRAEESDRKEIAEDLGDQIVRKLNTLKKKFIENDAVQEFINVKEETKDELSHLPSHQYYAKLPEKLNEMAQQTSDLLGKDFTRTSGPPAKFRELLEAADHYLRSFYPDLGISEPRRQSVEPRSPTSTNSTYMEPLSP